MTAAHMDVVHVAAREGLAKIVASTRADLESHERGDLLSAIPAKLLVVFGTDTESMAHLLATALVQLAELPETEGAQ